MTPTTKTFMFALPDALKAGLRIVKDRDGLSEAERIRRAITAWLETRGVKVKSQGRRADTRKPR